MDETRIRPLEDIRQFLAGMGETSLTLEGCRLSVIVTPNRYSRLELVMEDGAGGVAIHDGAEVLARGRMKTPHIPWAGARLSNGMPIESALPFMSHTIVNLMFHYACDNWNTGRGCRYCNIFANPVSKRLNDVSLDSLREMARLQAEAIKIVAGHGWRGNLAVTAGALPANARSRYLERVETVLSPLRETVG